MSEKNISQADVAHMSTLSRLYVSPDEQALFARQFGDILAYMDVLAEVDTTGIEPLYSPVQHEASLREDEARHLRSREAVLANAPHGDGEYFVVPRIV